jgi:hypothetical protein
MAKAIEEVKAWSKANPDALKMEMLTTQSNMPDQPLCIVCNKPVTWGVDGCPMVHKGQEMLALLGGGWEYMKHYDCEMPEKV